MKKILTVGEMRFIAEDDDHQYIVGDHLSGLMERHNTWLVGADAASMYLQSTETDEDIRVVEVHPESVVAEYFQGVIDAGMFYSAMQIAKLLGCNLSSIEYAIHAMDDKEILSRLSTIPAEDIDARLSLLKELIQEEQEHSKDLV